MKGHRDLSRSGFDTGDLALTSTWLIQRLVGQIAEPTGQTVEEVFEAETAAALHEQVVVDLVTNALDETLDD